MWSSKDSVGGLNTPGLKSEGRYSRGRLTKFLKTYDAFIFQFQSVWLLLSCSRVLPCLWQWSYCLSTQPLDNKKEGLVLSPNLTQHFCWYLIGLNYVMWPCVAANEAGKCIFFSWILATFLYILNKLDGVHFCAQMERNERSAGREGRCAMMS